MPQRRTRTASSSGLTLVELLVVLAVLTAMAGIVGLTWRPGQWDVAVQSSAIQAIGEARRKALQSGVPVKTTIRVDGRDVEIAALPDGRVIGAEGAGVDPVSGLVAIRGDSIGE